MKNCLIIFLLFLMSHFCYSQELNDTQIKGTISKPNDKTIKIGEDIVPFSENGDFKFATKIKTSEIYEITYGKLHWFIFLEPKARVTLKLTSDSLSTLEYEGDLKSSNDYLKKTSILKITTNDFLLKNRLKINSQSESRFISIIDSIKALFLNPLSTLAKNDKNISNNFVNLFNAEINFSFNRLIILYPERHFNYTGEKVTLSQVGLSQINLISPDNIEFFNLSSYKKFCTNLIDYKADVIVEKNNEPKRYCLKRMDAIFKLIPEVFKEQTLIDYWLSEYLNNFIERSGIINSENYIKEFNLKCKTEIYKTKINDLYASMLKDQSDHLVKTYKTVNGFNLQAHIFIPDNVKHGEKIPAIVIFHGGGWNEGNPSWVFDVAKHFRDLGMIAIAAQYRLITNGKDITIVECMADARDLIKWMRSNSDSLNILKDKIAAYGLSAGGHLVSSAAIFYDSIPSQNINSIPNAMILVSPAVSLQPLSIDWKLNVLGPNISVSSVDPIEHVRSGLPPTIILEGRTDRVTPLAKIQKFHDKMLENGNYCELCVFDGVGHIFTPSYLDDNWPQPDEKVQKQADLKVDEFLRKLGFINK